jgi:phosphoglycerate dehydrogenase-like enzyme
MRADGVKQVSLEELCRTSDIISVHARLVPETENMINCLMSF